MVFVVSVLLHADVRAARNYMGFEPSIVLKTKGSRIRMMVLVLIGRPVRRSLRCSLVGV